MQRLYPGYFISLEGGEGSGKTGFIPDLVEYLRTRGLVVFPTREPGGTSISEQIREVIHDIKNQEMYPETEALLYQAARAQIVRQVLVPRLNAGELIISDRYYDSTIAYQGYGSQTDVSKLIPVIEYATGGLRPDYTFLLDVEAEVGLSRKKSQDEMNRMDLKDLEYHKRVNQSFRDMASLEPQRWTIINANLPREMVYSELVQKVENRLIFSGLLEGNMLGPDRLG